METNLQKLRIPPELKEGQSNDWRTMIPDVIPEPTEIKLKPEWFKMGYYVYVVVIDYKNEKHFYVGMTGDKAYPTARSPFYRMSGHFSLADSSTQNQIIKGLKNKFNIDKKMLDKALQEMQITYYAWLLNEFDEDDHHGHRLKRICAEKTESALIQKMKKSYPDKVFNDGISIKDYEEVNGIAEQLLQNLKRKINE